MAQIEQSDKGGKKKGAQKKMHIHVDFTPMVDMNMLLITFFMLCTTMIKSQTLSISLPSNEKVENQEQMTQAKESEAITLILATERDKDGNVKKDDEGNELNTVYYYFGRPLIEDKDNNGLIDDNKIEVAKFLGNEGGVQRGIRKILHDRNKKVLEKIAVLKEDWRAKKFSPNSELNDSIYQARAREVRNDSTLTRPVVVIKATPEASWESLIGALDEMQINQIARYQIDNINAVDSALILDYIKKHPKK